MTDEDVSATKLWDSMKASRNASDLHGLTMKIFMQYDRNERDIVYILARAGPTRLQTLIDTRQYQEVKKILGIH